MSIEVKLEDDYKRRTHSVDQTKINKDEYSEVSEDSNSVQNLLEAGILVKKEESETSEEETNEPKSDVEQYFDEEKDAYVSPINGDEFDSSRGLKIHMAQMSD